MGDITWANGHEGALYGTRVSMRYEVYPPADDGEQWAWYAVDARSNEVYASGHENTRELALAAAEEHV
jgi:hypothetical protein